jgi:1-pyrroline-5-carboxylate dehydrogenase
MCDVAERESDLGPVINKRAFDRIQNVLTTAEKDTSVRKLCGGSSKPSAGFYVTPSIFEVNASRHDLLSVEIFGPVVGVKTWRTMDEVFDVMNSHNYRLTGSVISRNESFLDHYVPKLSEYAGNLYVNRKTTGAVVDQQPFGGDGASGTNYKAGSPHYLMNFLSPGTITRRHTRVGYGDPFVR